MGAFGGILEGEITSLPDNAFLSAVGGAAMLSPVPLTVLLALSLCLAYLAWRIISANYISIVTDKRGAGRVEYKRRSLEKNSAFVAMSKKELTKFFSSSLYMLNSAMGVVFTVVLSVIILVNRGVLVALSDEFALMGINGREMISALLIAALVMMSSMNMPSASALSLEGDNLWIIKTMPISSRTVLLAKCAPHIIVCATPTVLASVLLAIACGAPAVFWPFFILTPAVTNILFALVGIALNTAFPKLKFDNETQPIKQSMSIFLAMTAGFVWSLAVLGVSGLLSLLGVAILGVVAVFVLTSVAAAIMYAVVVGPCARKFEKL
jgi:ABC-2 type transport system permease protein